MAGEAGWENWLLELRQELKGPELLCNPGFEGLRELGIMGGFVLVMLLEP